MGIGIGYALSALLPGVDLSLGIVAGAVFSIGIINLFLRLMAALREARLELMEPDDELDEPLMVIPSRFLRPRSSSGRQKRKDK